MKETITGEGVWEYEEGTYEGELLEGFRHGYGTWKDADGSSYVGEWKNDVIHGQGTYTDTDGRTYKGTWENGYMR